ncbi:MAG: shikimate dehydrogenase [Clostridiales bacterium]|nr:shikimate dehydrogenase [Clostridiales bacterium]
MAVSGQIRLGEAPSVSGGTRLLALIGDPVENSLSPRTHTAFAGALGLPYIYLAFRITPGRLPAFVGAARTLNIAGFNVTMPHKQAIIPLLDRLETDAGAVNAVVNRGGELIGHNTDGKGFMLSLARLGVNAAGKRAVILGAGGAAKAVSRALRKSGARVAILCRRPGSADMSGADILSWEQTAEAAGSADMLVNATPLGSTGHAGFDSLGFVDALPAGALVYDLVSYPAETALMAAARRRGLTVVGGEALLVSQAALSFELFTGVAPDLGGA